jgi:hypothetical protein
MTSIEWGLISAACIVSGTLVGIAIGKALPKDHVTADSKDTLKIASGMMATLVALVLGLLVASAKNSYDTVNSECIAAGSKMIFLDRTLARYGPETDIARQQLQEGLQELIDRMWPEESNKPRGSGAKELEKGGSGMEHLQDFLDTLTPTTDSQRQIIAQARQIGSDLQLSRWLTVEQQQSTLPTTFLVVLFCWLTMLFTCIGVFAPRNTTVIIALLFCAISFSTAIFLIVELSQPLDGVMKISSAPLRNVLRHMGQF